MKITACKVNHLYQPMGYSMANVRVSWKVTDTVAKKQRAACVTVFQEGTQVYSTGEKNLDSICTPLPIQLLPRTRYTWQVEVWADNGEYAKSEENSFETAKMEEPWSAQWLKSPLGAKVPPVFTKSFALQSLPRRARIYITGLGLYRLLVNGEPVSDELLLPGCTSYDAHVQYQTFDLLPYLRQGENTVQVWLGDGWYKGRCSCAIKENCYGDDYGLLAEMHFDDEIIGTDASWTVTRCPVVFSGIYDGERFAPATAPGEALPALQAVCPHTLVARMGTPMRVQQQLAVKELIHTPKGEWVLDFGQNMSGFVQMKVCVPAGQTVRLQYGEVMQQGNFYRDNLRTAKAEYIFESDGAAHTLRPMFTFYGFRYVKVEGLGKPDIADFTACAIYSDLEFTGSIVTANEKVNQLISNAMWGQKSNYVDIPTDCPQRDERMGWTADTQVFTGTACLFTDAYNFLAKYMRDLAADQKRDGGSVPYYVPSFLERATCSVWGDAATIIPWTLYRYYGDSDILAAQYDSMRDWVEYIYRIDESTGSHRLWSVGFHFGDWLGLDNEAGNNFKGGTDDYYIASAFYWNSAKLVAKAARVLGKTADAEKYEKLSDEILAAIRSEYFTPTGRLAVTTQTGYVLALFMGLCPEGTEHKTRAALLQKLTDSKVHLKTGFVGTAYLCRVLSENRMNDLAYRLLLNEDYPGWLYCVNLGATTIWERWNSLLPDGTISGIAMNSLNHYSYGSICEWMFRNMAGLQDVEQAPGFRKAVLAPRPSTRIPAADMRYDSACGEYRVKWSLQDGTYTLDVHVPFGAQAQLTLPGCDSPVQQLDAGDYHYAYAFAFGGDIPEKPSEDPAWLSNNW